LIDDIDPARDGFDFVARQRAGKRTLVIRDGQHEIRIRRGGPRAGGRAAQGTQTMRTGFVGLGQMGAAMAANLVKAGHQVVVYNRSREKAEPLARLGATIAGSVAEACQGDAVVTMLADDAAAESLVLGDGGIAGALKPGALHVSCSTISVSLSRRMAAAHEGAGQSYVAAPVFGRPEAAAAGRLFVVAAGNDPAVEAARPIFDAIGQRTFIVSDRPEAANLVKLSGNFLIASVIESLGEAMALVGKGGIDLHTYLDLLTSTLFTAPAYRTYGGFIADRQFSPAGFAAPLGLKDMKLALAAAEELRVPMPVASLLRDRFLTLLANGGEALDWSAIGQLPAKDAGNG
jgi:3-hydroxyisobutyrate dehydrogenase-like beta-hydroxyacid dehydrogenase